MSTQKMFPVKLTDAEASTYPQCPRELPYEMVAEHENQVKLNYGRSVEELAIEGGLSPVELYYALNDKPFNPNISPDIAPGYLASLVKLSA